MLVQKYVAKIKISRKALGTEIWSLYACRGLFQSSFTLRVLTVTYEACNRATYPFIAFKATDKKRKNVEKNSTF